MQPLFDCMNMLGNWATWAEDVGLNWPDPPVTYATTYSVTLSAAMAGAGMALSHDAIAGRLIEAGALVAPFEHRAVMQEAYYLIQTPQAQSMPRAQAFVTWLRGELADSFPGRADTG
jgi:LysR family glycine cleavage system transcriptional activator